MPASLGSVPAPAVAPLLLGCDFSSSPSARKPIVLALGALSHGRVMLSAWEQMSTLEAWAEWLARPGDWVGGFDLPFGLPRELVLKLGWPTGWEDCLRHYARLSRAEVRATFAAFCAARPAGAKFAHRATDRPAGSSPSMKWVNPPVAYMLHAGVPRLLAAGVTLPGLHPGAPDNRDASGAPRRVALEAYPGLLAREVLGTRSYKSDERARQTPERLIARKDLVHALEQGLGPAGQPLRLGLRLKLSHAQRDTLVDDASGDRLDAVLCLMQAAWAWDQHRRGAPMYGLSPDLDPLEGWILTA